MKDIDEAIRHCKEKEKEHALNGCFACAEDHKQLAEWLRELKALKEEKGELAEKLKDRIEESVCKCCQMNKRFKKPPCELCEISRVFQIITLTAEEQKGGAE